MRRVDYRVLTAFAFLTVAGCGSSVPAPAPPESLQPVSGTVIVKGIPTEGVRVYLSRVEKTPTPEVTCTTLTDAEGKFVCPTYMKLKGLPVGVYDVRLVWPEYPSLEPQDDEVDRLRGRYNNPNRAAFSVEVKSGDNQLPPFEIN